MNPPDPNLVRVMIWPDGSSMLYSDYDEFEYGWLSDDYKIVTMPWDEFVKMDEME